MDSGDRLIEHQPMELGRDASSVKSLSRHTLEQMATLCSEGLVVLDAQDPNLPIVYVNPAFEALSGYAAVELAGHGWPIIGRAGEGQELERLKAALGRAEACEVTVGDLRKDGTPWQSRIVVEPLHNGRGEVRHILCIQTPVAAAAESASVEVGLLQRELGRARQKIATLDRIDPATGLLRFGYFQELLRRDLALARRDQRPVTVLLFEIVDFETYRRTFGGKAAESCMRMIGAQVTRVLRRAGDLCARCDDATLVASTVGQDAGESQLLAEQIASQVRQLGLHNPRSLAGRYITVATTLVTGAPGSKDDAAALINRGREQLRASAAVSPARIGG